MLELVLERLIEMRLLVLRCGINEERYDRLSLIAKSLTKSYDLELLKDDLESIYDQEWTEANKIWKYLTPKVWANYDLMDITGQTEQELLFDALLDLKEPFTEIVRAWRLRKRSRKSAFKKS